MPSLKRGFLFKYFDKLICGLVALGLLIGIAYALSRASALPAEIQPQRINSLAEQIRQKLQAKAHQLAAQVPSPADLAPVSKPAAVRPNFMIWLLPVQYPPIKVGLDKDFVLQFQAPLGEGTVTVQSAAPVVDILEHPVGGDYSKVKLHSRGYVGPTGMASANVVGYEGRIAHIYPVVVDAAVNKTAYAPTLAVNSQQGTVILGIVPDPKIAQDEVKVAYYEIWRRDWSDPLGKYELVDEVKPGGQSFRGATTTPRPVAMRAASAPPPGAMLTPFARAAAMPPGVGPGAYPGVGRMPGAATAAPAEEKPGIPWTDANVEPGNRYSYKGRAIGNNTFPTEGEFCTPVMAEVLPDIDFRFTLTTADSVAFDVVKAVGATGAKRERFWVGIGAAIGGIKDGESYLPGYILVDFQSAATRPDRPGLSARAIYADDKGNLRVLWSGETKANALWDRLKAATPARGGRMPMRPFGPVGRPGMR